MRRTTSYPTPQSPNPQAGLRGSVSNSSDRPSHHMLSCPIEASKEPSQRYSKRTRSTLPLSSHPRTARGRKNYTRCLPWANLAPGKRPDVSAGQLRRRTEQRTTTRNQRHNEPKSRAGHAMPRPLVRHLQAVSSLRRTCRALTYTCASDTWKDRKTYRAGTGGGAAL